MNAARRGAAKTAAQILRAEYGTSRNFITPEVLRRVLVRHPETGEIGAAEISMGEDLRLREHEQRSVSPRIVAVTVVWVGADGTRRRTTTDEPNGCAIFHDEPSHEDYWNARFAGEAYAQALEYVRGLGGRI